MPDKTHQPNVTITGGTFNAPVNLASNQGNQPTTIINTQNNYSGSEDDLRQQIEELHKFITELETKHPNVQTQAEAEAIREKAIANIQTTNPSRWKIIRQQMRLLKRAVANPERHLQAGKATLVEVAKKLFDKSLIATAIITYIDKLSETPDQGE